MMTKKADYDSARRIHHYLLKSASTKQEKYKILFSSQKFKLSAALHAFSVTLMLSNCYLTCSAQVK